MQEVDGLMLVHDLNNVKSYENLRRWHKEVMDDTKYAASTAYL